MWYESQAFTECPGRLYGALVKSVEESTNGAMRLYKYKHLNAEQQEEKRGDLFSGNLFFGFWSLHDEKYHKFVDQLHDDCAKGNTKTGSPRSLMMLLTAIQDSERMSS